eukprot:CAMPEP_0201939958 /NCGR_PEP_ID=MMETSP0903-20130614/44241_1 /ASSEMBLY_ACC=CAM_ASM_000552 /TAXON_ID=420261 /ORGANISM="Thalassiosira antarctica, Strain CCMP982" /LENGTH=568 /DNA_ID=CAMNT_0048481617 /DNA_START=38 /DNA_END=1744 /DNA_ORIENTATION=+
MATTSRLLAGLHRQWHITHIKSTSQLLVKSSQIKRPISTTWAFSQQQQRQPHNQQWQQQRHLSDHLKRRAIDALKSKNNANAAAADSTASNNGKTQSNPDRDGIGKSRNVGSMGNAKNNEGSPTTTANVTSSDNAAPVNKSDPTPDAPPTAPPSSPIPEVTSNADHNAPNATGAAATNVEENKEDDQTNSDDLPNSTSADDSNPWTHMHLHEFAPKIVVVGVGGAGTNAVNNMVANGLAGVEFLALNTDAQHLSTSLSPNRLQIGTQLTSGLGCGANPDAGRLAAEESSEAIKSCIEDAHMVFITAGMGGGTGTGAAPVVAGLCYDMGILTVSVVTTPFRFEGTHRRRLALEGVDRLKEVSDTLIVVPNQNLFKLVGEKTSFVDSFRLADNVLLAGVRSITDLMTSPGLINLDFADVQSVMHGMGNALLGTGQACHDDIIGSYGIGEAGSGGKNSDGKKETQNANDNEEQSTDNNIANECRAIRAAKMALNNPLLGEGNMDIGSAKGMLVNMTGGSDMTLYEVDRAAEYITERVLDPDANIIFGSAYDTNLTGCVRVSVVATGIAESE